MKLPVTLVALLTVGVSSVCAQSSGTQSMNKKFPSLELLENGEHTNMVTREHPIDPRTSYSASYYIPRPSWKRPDLFLFSLYGYHDKVLWENVTVVEFKIKSGIIGFRPHHTAKGEDRDKTDDRFPNAPVFENINFSIPADVARQIAYNGGVQISSKPKGFSIYVPASKLDRFKQLVDSVPAYEKSLREVQQRTTQMLLRDTTGLPLTEEFNESFNGRTLETKIAWAKSGIGVSARSIVSVGDRKLRPPQTYIFLMARTQSPAWANAREIILSFGGKRLRLGISDHHLEPMPDGTTLNVVSSRIPYRDFTALAAGGFSTSIGQASFAVTKTTTAGMRELIRRAK
jgi:hypothetical protein